MHELPVTEKILDIALKYAEANGASKIHSITLRVGGLTELEDKWLQHYFDYLSRDTIASGARLIVIATGVQLSCGECRTLIETNKKMLQDQICPHCGASEGFSILSGREYFIEELEAE